MSFSDTDMMNSPEWDNSVKRIGYKSLRGFIQILKRQNKSLKKLGCKVTFTVTLPIKD